jgi:hypothetical protein
MKQIHDSIGLLSLVLSVGVIVIVWRILEHKYKQN